MTVLALCVIRGNSNFTQYRLSICGIFITCLTHSSTSSSFSSASLSDICCSVSPCFTLFISSFCTESCCFCKTTSDVVVSKSTDNLVYVEFGAHISATFISANTTRRRQSQRLFKSAPSNTALTHFSDLHFSEHNSPLPNIAPIEIV